MHLHHVTFAEAQAMVPILNPAKVTRAAYSAEAWDIDTDLLLQGFARQARANGGRIRTGARVTAIARTADGWRVTWAGGEATARLLVNAAGAWAEALKPAKAQATTAVAAREKETIEGMVYRGATARSRALCP